MAQWKSANLAGILPAGLDSLLSTVESTVGTVSGILGTLKSVLQTAKTFLVSFPIFNWSGLLQTSITEFKNTFLGSGFYALLLWDYPIKQYYRAGSKGESFQRSFVRDVAAAFTDARDPNRPPLLGSCAMLVIVGGAPGLPGVTEGIKVARDAFSWWTELDAVYKQAIRIAKHSEAQVTEALIKAGNITLTTSKNDWTKTQVMATFKRARKDLLFLGDEDVAAAPSPGTSKASVDAFTAYVQSKILNSSYPDFQRIALRDILPPLVNVFDQILDPLVASLQSGRDAVAAITAMIDVLTAKVDALEDVINQIDIYISQLDALLAATGLYALWVESSSGVEALTQQFRNATDPPFGQLENGFYFGLVLVASGPNVDPFTALFKPVGG